MKTENKYIEHANQFGVNGFKWRCNTMGLLNEIAGNNGVAILKVPLNIFKNILGEVAERALELNDHKLNQLMCRLALYEESDPYSPEYDARKMEVVMSDEYIAS